MHALKSKTSTRTSRMHLEIKPWSFASNRFLRAKALCLVKQTSCLVKVNFFLAYTFFPKKEIKTKENKKQNLSLLDAYFKYTVK